MGSGGWHCFTVCDWELVEGNGGLESIFRLGVHAPGQVNDFAHRWLLTGGIILFKFGNGGK